MLGGFSDKFGRKIIMFVIIIHRPVYSVNGLVVVYFELNMYLFLIGEVTNGLTGGFGAALIAGYLNAADITPKCWRTICIGFVQVAIFAAAASSGAPLAADNYVSGLTSGDTS